eukprot:364686-Chlamydomonas_euryale.AAC.12
MLVCAPFCSALQLELAARRQTGAVKRCCLGKIMDRCGTYGANKLEDAEGEARVEWKVMNESGGEERTPALPKGHTCELSGPSNIPKMRARTSGDAPAASPASAPAAATSSASSPAFAASARTIGTSASRSAACGEGKFGGCVGGCAGGKEGVMRGNVTLAMSM